MLQKGGSEGVQNQRKRAYCRRGAVRLWVHTAEEGQRSERRSWAHPDRHIELVHDQHIGAAWRVHGAKRGGIRRVRVSGAGAERGRPPVVQRLVAQRPLGGVADVGDEEAPSVQEVRVEGHAAHAQARSRSHPGTPHRSSVTGGGSTGEKEV